MTQTQHFLFIGGSHDGLRKELTVREDGRMPELTEVELVENTLDGQAHPRERYLARRLEDKDSPNGSMFIFQHEHDQRGVCEALIEGHSEYSPPPAADAVISELFEGGYKIDRAIRTLAGGPTSRGGVLKVELASQSDADALSYRVGAQQLMDRHKIEHGLVAQISPVEFYRPGSLAKVEEAAQLGETKEVAQALVQGADWDKVIDIANDMIPKVLDLLNDEITDETTQVSAMARLLIAHGLLNTTGVWMTQAIGAGQKWAVPAAYYIARTMSDKIGAHIWEEGAPGQALN